MNDNFKHFDQYRRDRTKRRLEGGPKRDLGDNATVLRQIEAAEQKEVREQQLTREVHEFLQAATKQAATIVASVTENAEQKLDESVSQDMAEFLRETIRRAQELMGVVQDAWNRGVSRQDLEPHMQNLVGPALDGFRYAGNLASAEQNIGRDPFTVQLERDPKATPVAETPALLESTVADAPVETTSTVPGTEATSPQSASLADLPLPECTAECAAEPVATPAQEHQALSAWFARITREPELAKEALKALVRASMMTKDEARAIWRELHAPVA
ncbi:MAG: hypothetical protein HZB39_03415 [Planctomycetes bacterium]|nr:hypothetical protein [Planctomycetota bacterium]